MERTRLNQDRCITFVAALKRDFTLEKERGTGRGKEPLSYFLKLPKIHSGIAELERDLVFRVEIHFNPIVVCVLDRISSNRRLAAYSKNPFFRTYFAFFMFLIYPLFGVAWSPLITTLCERKQTTDRYKYSVRISGRRGLSSLP